MYLNAKMVLLLIAVGLFTLCGCGNVEKAEIDELIDYQESFVSTNRAKNVTIKGTVVAHESGKPLKGATVTVGDNSTVSNSDGMFTLTIEESELKSVGSAKLVGCTDLFFSVDFRRFEDGETVDWDIQMSRLQRPISFTPGQASSRTFSYLGSDYTATVSANAASIPFDAFVGPSGAIVGKGIPGRFALVNVSLQTDKDIDPFVLSNAVNLEFDILETAVRSGVGSIMPAALRPGAPAEAVEAAENYKKTINATLKILNSGRNRDAAVVTLLSGLYGDDRFEIAVLADATIVFFVKAEGILLPGLFIFDGGGKLIACQADGTTEVTDFLEVTIPHQGTPDGDG